MQELSSIKQILSQHKERLTKKYGLKSIAIFGSYARNQQTMDSDVDILVEFNRPVGIEFIDLADELEQLLSIKVDLVSKDGLKIKYMHSIVDELEYV